MFALASLEEILHAGSVRHSSATSYRRTSLSPPRHHSHQHHTPQSPDRDFTSPYSSHQSSPTAIRTPPSAFSEKSDSLRSTPQAQQQLRAGGGNHDDPHYNSAVTPIAPRHSLSPIKRRLPTASAGKSYELSDTEYALTLKQTLSLRRDLHEIASLSVFISVSLPLS